MSNTTTSNIVKKENYALSTLERNDKVETNKYLTFFLKDEEYGIEISKVIEIIGEMPIVPIPKLPDYIKGIINLRGRIVPIVNLRLKLGMADKEMTDESVIIIVSSSNRDMGLIIDKVTEVLDIRQDNIDDAPEFGTSINTEYIIGIAKQEDSIKIILDIDKVINSEKISESIEDNNNNI